MSEIKRIPTKIEGVEILDFGQEQTWFGEMMAEKPKKLEVKLPKGGTAYVIDILENDVKVNTMYKHNAMDATPENIAKLKKIFPQLEVVV